MTSYSYKDAAGVIHWSDSSAIPVGCTRHSVRVPQSFIDGAVSAAPTRDSMKHFYTDTRTGVTFPSDSATVPPGCVRSSDNHTSAKAASGARATADAAVSDGDSYLADTLKACTTVPGFLVDRVNRGVMDAKAAASEGALSNALDNLRSAGRQLATRAFTAQDGASRDALNRAASAVAATADALSVQRNAASGVSDANPKDARAAMAKRLSDGWK